MFILFLNLTMNLQVTPNIVLWLLKCNLLNGLIISYFIIVEDYIQMQDKNLYIIIQIKSVFK